MRDIQVDILDRIDRINGSLIWINRITLKPTKYVVSHTIRPDEDIPLKVLKTYAADALSLKIVNKLTHQMDKNQQTGDVSHIFSIDNCEEKERDVFEQIIKGNKADITRLNRALDNSLKTINTLKSTKFLGRLKMLFKGVK